MGSNALLEEEKTRAAARAVEYVRAGMTIGLGSGTTTSHFVARLGEEVRKGLRIRAVPTSVFIAELARRHDITLVTLEEAPALDMTVDGADAVDPALNVSKGRGGALLHEKIVAGLSDLLVIIVDSSKWVEHVTQRPVAIEVVPFAWRPVAERLKSMAEHVELRMRDADTRYATEHGNYVLDCRFNPVVELRGLAQSIRNTPGVIEHGLFLDLADVVIVGRRDGVDVRRAARRGPW